ncbi:MAG TPA: SAM-dependent methyltransferase [Streptosporangiaceae bacterium]|nr:SAM-dependent methyltransferase [Streptosporangiaceae bacterium]
MTDVPQPTPEVDTSRPSAARIYDFMLGGCNNYPADREAAAKLKDVVPEFHEIAWANRGFHQRAARWIADRGIGQFIDLGSGLPTVGNTHEVVREVLPTARVAYVDSDPTVAAHARALQGDDNAVFVQADLRDPAPLLENPALLALIDFAEPVGLLMTAVLHFVADGSDPWGLVQTYLRPLAAGSYLALSHATSDGVPPIAVQRWQEVYADAPVQLHLRSRASVRRFFTGLEMVPPYDGAPPEVAHLGLWGCEDPRLADSDGSRWGYCGVARRP